MTHEEFVIKALEMFDGQFPNEITMRKPNFETMESPEHNISVELRQWIIVTLGKYKELVK